uniref:Hydrocephalus-inducing protein homolog isoform X3 n=1 Tax=Petromyzon marinus TaxID=7757 RepID=A0AAJ7WXF6_PETMA|nr:hydrocephalus-inducing protein homolog isoform X3 [Petromyzon marinus]
MPLGREQAAISCLQYSPSKLPEGFQSRVVAPRNPKLVPREEFPSKVTPSDFMKEMALTTEEKLAGTHEMHLPKIIQLLDMNETTHQKYSLVDIDQAMFQPFPSEITFQNFEPCETYEVPLNLRNNDRVPRLVKVSQEDSPYFKIISPNDVGTKVAPGMASTFRIVFTPEQKKDYTHQVVCVTEREKFMVPVRAIGSRAILDFPDVVAFSQRPVKLRSERTLLVRNVGNRHANFSLQTERPFSVEPVYGALVIGESMQVTVAFTPQTTGDHSAELWIHYDTGEDICVDLHGAAVDVNVRLDKNSVVMERTFISMASHRSVLLSNRMDAIAHFQWRPYATAEEEEQQKLRFCSELSAEEARERNSFLSEYAVEPGLRDRLSILTRSFQQRRHMIKSNPMHFSSDVISIEPLEGDIWPNSSAEITVIFKPQEARVYQHTAYCDVTGRETRLPLRIRGEGIGPCLLFNCDQLDIGNVFMSSQHSYEVILANKGEIDGIFSLDSTLSLFGRCFTLEPFEGIVLPGGHQAIVISFQSQAIGNFSEDLLFTVDGSSEKIKLTISGRVIGPTFNFDVPSLDFGDVSFGFPGTQQCTLINTSLVAMEFALRVPGDGAGSPSVSSHGKEHMTRQGLTSRQPREFSITPSSGKLQPQERIVIQVTLCSNTVTLYEGALVVDVKGVGEEVLALPISANCVVPQIDPSEGELDFGRCFLRYSYRRKLLLTNASSLPARYDLQLQSPDEVHGITFGSPSAFGVLEPASQTELPLLVHAQQLGEQSVTANIVVFGSKEPPVRVRLLCMGQGPVVHVTPADVSWGPVSVLDEHTRTLKLSNQSPIPAHFSVKTARANSLWRVVPAKGSVPPEGVVELAVAVRLDDTVAFRDKLHIVVEEGQPCIVPLQAVGIGTTIVARPPITPTVNLGHHFSSSPCQFHLTLTNMGRRAHQLYWMSESFPAPRSNAKKLGHRATGRGGWAHDGTTVGPPPSTRAAFSLHPTRMELAPGESIDVLLQGFSDVPKVVSEQMVCHAIIGKQSGKERIMRMNIRCEFIQPLLELSSRQISFVVEKRPEDTLQPQYEQLKLKNVSSLPLAMNLSLEFPFSIILPEDCPADPSATALKLGIGEEQEVTVAFEPGYRDDAASRVATGLLTIEHAHHPHRDHVALLGHTHFPNLSFDHTSIDFGCVLNHTEVERRITMVNCSPLPVYFCWSFLQHDGITPISHRGEGTAVRSTLPTLFEYDEHRSRPHVGEVGATPVSRLLKERSSLQSLDGDNVNQDEEEEGVNTSAESGVSNRLTVPDEGKVPSTGLQEVFDILPLYGQLQPGESQAVTVSFFGHAGLRARATALCRVVGGPTYEISLLGEAADMSYQLSTTEVDYGKVLFDRVAEVEITLRNTGSVGFWFTGPGEAQGMEGLASGVPYISPHTGFVGAATEQIVRVLLLPGVPEPFQHAVALRIAHFEPEVLKVYGEGVFPIVHLDLPRNMDGYERFQAFLKEADKGGAECETSQEEHPSRPGTSLREQQPDESCLCPEVLLEHGMQLELERFIISEHARLQASLLGTQPSPASSTSEHTLPGRQSWKKLSRVRLPEYILDFKHVILGNVRTHIVKISNPGCFPVSFQVERNALAHTGFSAELYRMKNFPPSETETFEVRFDPRGASLGLGPVDVLLNIQVVGGPIVGLRLRAIVTMPDLEASSEELEFGDVQCGQCHIVNVQLHNKQAVTCEWTFTPPDTSSKQADTPVAALLRRKVRATAPPPPEPPRVFELLPASGTLTPGQRMNVQVKFTPTQEKRYCKRLALRIAQSSRRVLLVALGRGLEPRLELSATVLEFTPMLPQSTGDTHHVTVRNPCPFPIEFYSLEFDTQYLEEEKILRHVKGYHDGVLLLPPRLPGEKLPPEILQDYEEKLRKKGEAAADTQLPNGETTWPSTGAAAMPLREEDESETTVKLDDQDGATGPPATEASVVPRLEGIGSPKGDKNGEVPPGLLEDSDGKQREALKGRANGGVGELELTPVAAALARHLGIDLSPEGRAAQNRRGIAIVVHGAPSSGKTSAAVWLARRYGAARLTLDGVVLDCLSSGTTVAGLRARQLCADAAHRKAVREAEEAGLTDPSAPSRATPALSTVGGSMGGLSMEAVAKHSAYGMESGVGGADIRTAPSSISIRHKGSTIAGKSRAEAHSVATRQLPSEPPGSQAPSVSMVGAPLQRRLSVSASVAGEDGLLSCVLPEELLIDILAERLQLSDCHRGVVLDGLETLYAATIASAAHVVLKALNNRRFIFLVDLKQDLASLEANEQATLKKQEAELVQRLEEKKRWLEELDEDEYNALSDEKRMEVDSLHLAALKERKACEEADRLAKQELERLREEELERQREEEEKNRKSRKGKKDTTNRDDQTAQKKSQATLKPQVPSVLDRSESQRNEALEDGTRKKNKGKEHKGAALCLQSDTAQQPAPTITEPDPSDEKKELERRFKAYEQSQKDVQKLLDFWDRTQGTLVLPPTPETEDIVEAEDEKPPPSGKKSKRERERERLERERERVEQREKAERERLEKLRSDEKGEPSPAPGSADSDRVAQERPGLRKAALGIPHVALEVTDPREPIAERLLAKELLPSVDEVLDGLGLGPSGPPIPPPVTLSVVPFPGKRKGLPPKPIERFQFVEAVEETGTDEKDPNGEVEPEPEPCIKEELTTPTRGKGRGKDKLDSAREKVRSPQRKSATRSPPQPLGRPASAQVDGEMGSTQGEALAAETRGTRLKTFRWVVDAGSQVELHVSFSANDADQFDETLNLEVLGTRRRYQLYCRGVCTFPSINQNPRIVFPHRKKSVQPNEIVHKQFVLSTDVFEFGPLLCGKTRERYKDGRYPENMERLNIQNSSPMLANVTFCFQNDAKATTFLLDPPTMTLQPKQEQTLTLWAYPTSPGCFEDVLVCCVHENPEPAMFRVRCHGMRPELELERKQLHFDKLLLHRKDTRTLTLKNNTLAPVAWHVSGLDSLGDEFSLDADQGIVPPRSQHTLHAYFRALKPVNIKKMIRLEISDVENIMGIVHTENIQVIAEAYDVALDLTLPKGSDGGLDFGVIRVSEEAKQTFTMKNKGKYEISFSFGLEAAAAGVPDVSTLFSVQPQKGSLLPTERHTPVTIMFHGKREVSITEQPILRCQVIEPSVGHGEAIASIPVKLSACAVYSKYAICPANDINFGPLVVNTRKTCTFTIENRGDFDFKYSIQKLALDPPAAPQRKGMAAKRVKAHETHGLGRLGNKQKRDSLRPEAPTAVVQARLSLGMFTVFPGFGTLLPGGQQIVTVECAPEYAGSTSETLALDISERDPSDHPAGIPYSLFADACIPSIVINDFEAIFEEQHMCRSATLSQVLASAQSGSGAFVEDESRFVFHGTIVGHRATARFKILNCKRVPCDVVFYVKPVSSKAAARIGDIFSVEPARACVPSHSHMYAEVSFIPQAMQSYQCTFEANVEGLPSGVPRPRGLIFDVCGEGTLPHVSVLRPALRCKQGAPLMLFQRLLLGRAQTLPLSLCNDSTLPAQINVDLLDEMGAFKLKVKPGTKCLYPLDKEEEANEEPAKRAHAASLVVRPGESADLEVRCSPGRVGPCRGSARLTVLDNPYAVTMVRLVGEGYSDTVTLDNFPSPPAASPDNTEETSSDPDDVQAARAEHLNFGDCHIGRPYQLTFTMSNHSTSEAVRFEWPFDLPQLKFSPQVGHLHASCTKDVTATFLAHAPGGLHRHALHCRLWRMVLQERPDSVPDWDDRLHTVRWVDAMRSSTSLHSGTGAKTKVVETEREPPHTLLDSVPQELVLTVSAVADLCRPQCKTEPVHFRDTLMFQTRIYQLELENTGLVSLPFSWHVQAEDGRSNQDEPQEHQRTEVRPASRAGGLVNAVLAYGTVDVAQEDLPFSVEPPSGSVPPGATQQLQLRFSPLDVGEFRARLVCSIPNLGGQAAEPSVSVSGCGLMPWCHFEVADSDYLSGGRRNPELPGRLGAPPGSTLPPDTRVIEMHALGVHTCVTKSFYILNPSSNAYSFSWQSEDPPGTLTPFTCRTPGGVLEAGRKSQVVFEFAPTQLNLAESFWKFEVAEHGMSVPFLLVGQAREPAVSLDRSHLNLHSLLVGQQAMEVVDLCNIESEAFSFSFREESCHSEGRTASLAVQPMEGTIQANSRIPIQVSFKPSQEGPVNFNLQCRVKRKSHVLTLNVKAEGYSLGASLRAETPQGERSTLSATAVNDLALGQVELHSSTYRLLDIDNEGAFDFNFEWELQTTRRDLRACVTMSPNSGSVQRSQRTRCTLTFQPTRPCVLRDVQLHLKIQNGPTFVCTLNGSGEAPSISVNFSMTTFDFGPCFIHQAGMDPHSTLLRISNGEDRDISLECLFKDAQHLKVDFKPTMLVARGDAIDVPITFYPRRATRYRDDIIFVVNGVSQHTLEVRGEGTEMKIEVANPKWKVVNLGALRVGQTSKKTVPLVNNSRAPLTFSLALQSSQPALQDPKVLILSPSGEVTLRPRDGTCAVEVSFSPCARVPAFTAEVCVESAGVRRPVFLLKGCCQGLEMVLDQEQLPFGAVVLRSQATRRLLLHNMGDVGASFSWDVKHLAPDFSVSPARGYAAAGMDVPLDVTFHPRALGSDIRYEGVKCSVEGSPPLLLTLTGSCIDQLPSREVLNFRCPVRSRQTQTISLANRTNQRWVLRPVLKGEHWTGADSVIVEAQQQGRPYEVTYEPLTMTSIRQEHQGSIFFPLPDGLGLLYPLQGIAEPPRPTDTITRDVPCKTTYTELLPVANWLHKPQRFRMTLEMVRPERLDPSTTLKGLDYIDVPGSATHDYKLTFHSHKEGQFTAKVTFCNEATQEFLFYVVTMRATPGGSLGTVELCTPVRRSTEGRVRVENPLPTPVSFSVECRVPDISLPPQISVPPNAKKDEGWLTLEYLPLRVGESSGRLVLQSAELGAFTWDLQLRSLPAAHEKPLHFRASLGASHVQAARFVNYSRQKTEYACKITSGEFHVEKTVTAAPGAAGGTEVSVDVLYEPSHLGDTRALLTLSSPQGGEYTIPLVGVCSAPRPQGPFTVRAGSSVSVPFKNVFAQTASFMAAVDSPAFSVRAAGEAVRPKRTITIVVGFEGAPGAAPVTARLTVSCPQQPASSWIFYLRGVSAEK